MNARKQKTKLAAKKSREIVVNETLLYSERNIWSPTFKAWARYRVSKPRLPNDADSGMRWVDDTINYPRNFSSFVGKHNEQLFGQLKTSLEIFESTKSLPDVNIISGPAGSGKSAISTIFCQNLIDVLNLTQAQSTKFILTINAAEFRKDFNPLWIKINRFADAVFEKFLAVKYRLVMIDNIGSIPPSNQQDLKKIMEAQGSRLRYLFVTDDPKAQLLSYIVGRATIYKTKQIPERDALMIILTFCNKNSIGFDLEGIKFLFSIHSNLSLTNMLDTLQKVFVQKNFISKENVSKVSGVAMEMLTISPAQALEPLTRCTICTLLPPCKHIPSQIMAEMGMARRAELPRYKNGSMSCPEFVRCGNCSIFNKYGHCSLDHPKNVHNVVAPPLRCATCTIPWPCNHCAYTSDRLELMAAVEEIQTRMSRARQINVPDPPRSLTRHLRVM